MCLDIMSARNGLLRSFGSRLFPRKESPLADAWKLLIVREKSSFFKALLPAELKDALKSTVLKEAAREDSRLWTTNATPARHPRQQVNGHVNGALTQHQQPPQYNLDGGVNDGLLLEDTLNDLYIPNATSRYWPQLPPAISQQQIIHADPFALTKAEIGTLSQSIRDDLIGTDHPVLHKAASYFFQATVDGGKKVRPMMVLLISRALSDTMGTIRDGTTSNSNNNDNTDQSSLVGDSFFASPLPWQRSDLPASQRRLAEISEMIHIASLLHDDVIDGADTRRSAPAVHMVFGNKMAILAGDYLLARASISLARLRNVRVVEAMSTVIEHLVRGEVMQMKGSDSGDANSVRMVQYLRKNFYKTGSLMANSCRSAALLGDYPEELVAASYNFGKHVGMAFQLMDDVLDFEGSLASLGKPALSDLKGGLATAPMLLAAQERPELWTLVDRQFREPGDVDRAVECVYQSTTALEQSKEVARVHAERAMDAVLTAFRPSPHRDALVLLANKVVARTK